MWERDLPNGFLMESNGRFESQIVEMGLGQVDGAHIGVQTLGDQFYDVAQSVVEAVRSRDDLGDIG
jgi:hypothetical protein